LFFTCSSPEYTKKDEEGTGKDERVPFVLCHYRVFNVEQCDGPRFLKKQPTTAPEIDEDHTLSQKDGPLGLLVLRRP
jgi:antirestriction protein ArdC